CSAFSAVRYLDVGRHADDFNGDGYADLIVGAYKQNNPELAEGNAYVYFGSPTGPATSPDVTLDNPLDQADGWFGIVASAGDINGDGYADLMVSAYPQDNPEVDEGTVYVYFGSATGPGTTPDITLDNPLNQAGGSFGHSVASAGDVNADGFADLIVGAASQANPEAGEGVAYVYFGSPTGPRASPDISLDNPTDQAGGRFGHSVASVGDVNADGYADVIVGAYSQSNPERNEGAAYVYFGSASGPATSPNTFLDNPLDQESSRFGVSVASASDVNSDGYSDIIVGAHFHDNPEDDEGAAFLYFGSATGPRTAPDISLDNPLDRTGGQFGISTSAGDVNGDGFADIIVGARYQNGGSVYLYLGSTSGPAAVPDVSLDDPLSGLFGQSITNTGDINGDGYTDIVVGAYLQDNPEVDEGAAHIYFGSTTGPKTTPDISLDNPTDQAGGGFGVSVARADINDDLRHRACPPCQRRSQGAERSR
ncbi:MAG: FG-GAP repeat protein, partial [Deltaproteobacteria bacterium]|nr:FG-GAP repeat protein [Deltaproteobacteria bacterium]